MAVRARAAAMDTQELIPGRCPKAALSDLELVPGLIPSVLLDARSDWLQKLKTKYSYALL